MMNQDAVKELAVRLLSSREDTSTLTSVIGSLSSMDATRVRSAMRKVYLSSLEYYERGRLLHFSILLKAVSVGRDNAEIKQRISGEGGVVCS